MPSLNEAALAAPLAPDAIPETPKIQLSEPPPALVNEEARRTQEPLCIAGPGERDRLSSEDGTRVSNSLAGLRTPHQHLTTGTTCSANCTVSTTISSTVSAKSHASCTKINLDGVNSDDIKDFSHFTWCDDQKFGMTTEPVHRTVLPDREEEAVSHHERPQSILTAIAAGVINYLLMFGLCCAFGMILFSDDWHAQHRALGVKMTLSTALVLGLMLALTSRIPVAIGGPDLTPVVFLGSFVTTIAEEIATQMGLAYPSVSRRRLMHCPDARLFDVGHIAHDSQSRRLAGGSSNAEFCIGAHLDQNRQLCASYREELIPTVIAAVSLSSLLLGIIFYGLGRFKMTRLVSFVPTCIMEAFLSCIGYKVFKYALQFCKYEPKQFIPAAGVGVLLYFVKAMHLGNPAIVIPMMLFAPLGAFYFYIYVITGSDLEQARKDNLMFPKMENVEFWTVWTESWFKLEKINRGAMAKIGPEMIMMIVVCLLDCLLKLSSTESKLPVSVNKDYEIRLHGLGNFVTFFSGSSVGYMQLKFNVINFGVMGNTTDRRAGAIYALLCGAGFFSTMEHFNYLPRFFLGILLFFAGAGFVAENLWGSRMYLSLHEWMQILVILVVFIFTDKLLYAVIVGGVLTGFDFIIRYARVPCTAGNPLRGGELVSKERFGPVLQRNLQHIANSWLLIIRLKGYVFFASAQKLTQFIRNEIESQAEVPEYRRLKYITIDCQLLDGMDASATKAMKKLEREAHALGMRILWSHVEDKFVAELKNRGLIETEKVIFQDLDEVKTYVERHAFEYRTFVQKKWMRLHPAFMLAHEMLRLHMAFEPFAHVFLVDAVRRGCPWQYCGVLKLTAWETVLWEPGEMNQDLYLIHSGSVGIFSDRPKEGDDWGDCEEPIAIYRHGWFLNREILIRAPTRYYGVACSDGEVLYWNERQFSRMAREVPFMASAISKMVMKQQVLNSDLEQLVVHPHDMPVFDELADEEDLFSAGHSVQTALSMGGRTHTSKSLFQQKSSRTLATDASDGGSSIELVQTTQWQLLGANLKRAAKQLARNLSSGSKSSKSLSPSSKSSQHPPNVEVLGIEIEDVRSESVSRSQIAPVGKKQQVAWAEAPKSHESETSNEEHQNLEERPLERVISISTVRSAATRNASIGSGPAKTEQRTTERAGRKRSSQRSGVSFFGLLPHLLDGSLKVGSPRAHDESEEPGKFVQKKNAESLSIPEQLQNRLNGIQTAQVLDKFKLYSSVADSQLGSLPVMPKSFRADLEIAFSTYCQIDDNSTAYLDHQNLSAALMYAGIFNTVMRPATTISRKRVYMPEFIQLGHRAVMATLSVEQDHMIEQIFHEFDHDGSGDFDRDEMIHMFRRMFHPDISIEEVDGVANAWIEHHSSGKIDLPQFRAIMSHIIREHEQDWSLLCGFRELMNSQTIHNNDKLTAEMMVKNSAMDLTISEAQELLWVSDWRLNGKGKGEFLEFTDVVAAVLLDIDLDCTAKLPPRPKIPSRQRHSILQQSLPESQVPDAELDLPEELDKERSCSDSVANLIVDMREKAYEMKQLFVWAKLMAPKNKGSDTPGRSDSVPIPAKHEISQRIVDKHDGKWAVKKAPEKGRHHAIFDTFKVGENVPLSVRVWCLLEEPRSSRAANLLSIFMGTMIMASVIALVLHPLSGPGYTQTEKHVWAALELFFTFIFTMELIVRFVVADAVGDQTKLGFLSSPGNICDFAAVLPYYVEAIYGQDKDDPFKLLRVARLMRLARMMRVAKLSKRSTLFGPVAMVLTVIWGIYLKTVDE